MSQIFTTKAEIEIWCDQVMISNYTISDNLVVDVYDDVILYLIYMDQLPIQFGTVSGDFILGENGLKTFKGVPSSVGGDFICGGNQIKDLDFFPLEIHDRIILLNNPLESFTSPLEKANNIIWISQIIPGLTYLDIDENGYYKYNVEDYLKWNYDTKYFMDEKAFFI